MWERLALAPGLSCPSLRSGGIEYMRHHACLVGFEFWVDLPDRILIGRIGELTSK